MFCNLVGRPCLTHPGLVRYRRNSGKLMLALSSSQFDSSRTCVLAVARFRASASSDKPTCLARRERTYDGMSRAGIGRMTAVGGRVRSPKWVKTGLDDLETGLPKYPRKLTFSALVGMSQTCQFRKWPILYDHPIYCCSQGQGTAGRAPEVDGVGAIVCYPR
jgi:hypothetical protein